MTKYVNNNGVSEMWANTKNYISAQLLGKSDVGHTHSASDITSGLATVATSGSYNDLSNKPTIPTVNNATLTIQRNGATVKTFTANASANVTADITVPTKTSDLTNDSGFLTSHQDLSGYVPRSGGEVMTGNRISRVDNTWELCMDGGRFYGDGATLTLFGKNTKNSGQEGNFWLTASNTTTERTLLGTPDGTLTWGSKHIAMQEDVVPRSGGAVISGNTLGRIDDTDLLFLNSGSNESNGGHIVLFGAHYGWGGGAVRLNPASSATTQQFMYLYPDGNWTWQGTAVQLVSDQRLKQQIAEIDDDLLTAWEDVNLVQFKYNDAVEEKSDNARLHTGYVVQQIDEACKSHGVDVSKYGLYCHEEYAEETREVEHEDGTKTTEVVRPASEHYSLRYTEALIVECAYLRKCIKELRTEIEELKSSK